MNTPDDIKELPENGIFVFGSNYAGRHGKGAALVAKRKFGARDGQGMGLMGRSYGIATKGHRLEVLGINAILMQVLRFLRFAESRPHLTFYVTKIGCGLAGYSPREIAPMFHGRTPNVVLPQEFEQVLTKL